MSTIDFACEKCGASLKVRATFAGRSVQCPKCLRKTAVPGPGGAAETPEASPPAPAPASAPAPTPEPAPAPPPVAPPKAPDVVRPSAELSPVKEDAPHAPLPAAGALEDSRLREYEERVKELEAQIEVAGLRAQQAEAAAREARTAGEAEREELRHDAERHFAAELDAAKESIADLESKLASAYREKVAQRGVGRSTVESERDVLQTEAESGTLSAEEVVDADALIAEIKQAPFGRYLRLAVIAHAVVILLTSIGYLYARFRDRSAAEGEVAPAAENAAPAPVAAVTAAPVAVAPAVVETPAAPAAAKTDLERRVESLPAPGEAPRDTDVKLDL